MLPVITVGPEFVMELVARTANPHVDWRSGDVVASTAPAKSSSSSSSKAFRTFDIRIGTHRKIQGAQTDERLIPSICGRKTHMQGLESGTVQARKGEQRDKSGHSNQPRGLSSELSALPFAVRRVPVARREGCRRRYGSSRSQLLGQPQVLTHGSLEV